MNFGSKYVYLGNEKEDEEYVKVSEDTGVILSDSDESDDDGETCMLDILDTAGQEEYSSMKDMYVKDGSGFVIIYSIVDKQSFEEAEAIFNWLRRVRSDDPSYQILIANKQDLAGTSDVQVTSEQGRDLAKKMNIPFFETSAKTGDGVIEALTGLIKIIPRASTDYKIVMLGSGAVGKSSITLRFVSNTFLDDYDPTIEDSFRKMVKISGIPSLSADQKKALKSKKRNKGKKERRNVLQYLPKSKGAGGITRDTSLKKFSVKAASAPQVPPHINAPQCSSQQRIKTQKQDGNVVLISLRTLEENPCLVTGDPIKCSKCQAILTSTGKLEVENETKSWTCEFCGNINSNLDISEDEIPEGESFDYMLCPATQPKEKQETEEEASQEMKTTPGVIVYCMDISSSMKSLCRVPDSHVAWRQERTRGAESISGVSKLNCIQKAVERLSEELKLEQPEKQVLLAVFSSEVYIKAGGREDDLPSFKQLDSKTFQELLEMGLCMSNDYPLKPISESHEAIDAAVKALQLTGCTALGPALTICAGFVSKIPSSEIVLCTDGMPNVGIGSLGSGCVTGDFYTQIGNYARQKNITINILAVEGDNVGLQTVSKAAELSGGTTNKLNPMEIVRQLRLIAQNEVVATSVTVRLFLHPNFVFNEDGFGDNLSQLEKEVGSVRKETDMTFRYKLKDESAKSTGIDSVPFQVQITYTRPDGMQCLRVLSKANQVTSIREEMEKNINVPVLTVAAMKTTSKMAQEGKGKEAQHMLKKYKRMVDRGAVTTSQKEERLAFRSEVQNWDYQLTDNNVDFATGALGDTASSAAQQVQGAYMLRCAAPMDRAIKRKQMGAQSKASYYAYKDSY